MCWTPTLDHQPVALLGGRMEALRAEAKWKVGHWGCALEVDIRISAPSTIFFLPNNHEVSSFPSPCADCPDAPPRHRHKSNRTIQPWADPAATMSQINLSSL